MLISLPDVRGPACNKLERDYRYAEMLVIRARQPSQAPADMDWMQAAGGS